LPIKKKIADETIPKEYLTRNIGLIQISKDRKPYASSVINDSLINDS